MCFSYSNEICLKLNNVTIADLNNIPINVPIEDLPDKFKCYCKCLLKDILDENGKMDVGLALNSYPVAYVEKVKTCKKRYDHMESESCNYAAFAFSCLHFEQIT